MKTTRPAPVAAILALLMLGAAPAAEAAKTVFDPWNLTQNVLQAARSLEQIKNQITSLQNEARVLVNQARNLATLDYSSLAQIDSAMARIGGLLLRAEGVAYDVAAIEDQFAELYPESYEAGASAERLIADARARWQQALAGFRHALTVQAGVVTGIPIDQAEMATLVGRSQGAVGMLQATQAGNQLVALQVKQLADLQAMLAADGRARALAEARAAAAEEQAREQRRRFLEPGTPYTPVPVRMFHD